MKKELLFALLLSLFISNYCFGQNLVPNPSFEDFDTCPDFLGRIGYAKGWRGSRQTPDYYNECAFPFSTTTVPLNYYGNQNPASGNAYAGVMVRVADDSWNEALGVNLISPLTIGTEYFVSFKVSLAECRNPSLLGNYCGVNKLGAIFTTTPYTSDLKPLPRCNFDCAQVYSEDIISDTSNWVRISGSFVADSSYESLSLGRLVINSLTDTNQIAGHDCNAYYFIDDVCVSTDSLYTSTYNYMDITKDGGAKLKFIKIYPNPADDWILVELNNELIAQLILVNSIGQQFLNQRIEDVTGKVKLNITDFSSGGYFLIIRTNNNNTFNCSFIKL